MSAIKQIEDHKTFWKRSTMEIITYTEGSLADIIQLARKDILSLITTIESQKEEIKAYQRSMTGEAIKNANYEKRLKQSQAITELAVKCLEQIRSLNYHGVEPQHDIETLAKTTIFEIARLQND